MALKALSYWIVFKILHPDASLDDLLFFRRNDIEYFQLIAPFARLDFSSFSTIEHDGTGLISMPLAQVLPYALGYALGHTAGIVAADVVVSLATFVLFSLLLIGVQVPARLAKLYVLSLLVVEITLTKFLAYKFNFAHGLFSFWDLRFPKPFVSLPLLLWTILCIVQLWQRRDRLGAGFAAASAVSFAALIQTDVFLGFAQHLVLAAFLPMLAWATWKAQGKRGLARIGGAFVIAYGIAITPFLLQRVYDAPDFLDRMGFNRLDRLAPPFLTPDDIDLGFLPPVAYLVYLAVAARLGRLARVPPTLHVLAAGVAAAYLSMPAMVMVNGSIAQSFHFVMAYDLSASLLFLTLVLSVLADFGRSIGLAAGLAPLRGITAEVLVAMVVYALYVPLYDAQRRQAQIQTYVSLRALTHYRSDSIGLRREMRSGALSQAQVVGTLDPHIAAYALYRGKHIYVPDAGLDFLTEKEQMARLLTFCAVLRLPEEDVAALMARSDVQLFWGTAIKYNVERFRGPYALSEYTPDQIRQFNPEEMEFNIHVPRFALRQMLDDYRRIVKDPGALARFRLDAIVLPSTSDVRNADPDPADWQLAYENASFRGWVRRRREAS